MKEGNVLTIKQLLHHLDDCSHLDALIGHHIYAYHAMNSITIPLF